MAYVTVTSNASGQVLGFDTAKPDNLTLNMSSDVLKDTVTSLEAALDVAKKAQAAFASTSSTTAG